MSAERGKRKHELHRQGEKDQRPLPAQRPPEGIEHGTGSQESIGIVSASWHGPLPPPDVLRAFGEAVPGADTAIVEEFRMETKHRRSIEDRKSRAEAFMSRVLSLSVAGLPYAALATGVIALLFGYPLPGIALIGGLVVIDASMRWKAKKADADKGEEESDSLGGSAKDEVG